MPFSNSSIGRNSVPVSHSASVMDALASRGPARTARVIVPAPTKTGCQFGTPFSGPPIRRRAAGARDRVVDRLCTSTDMIAAWNRPSAARSDDSRSTAGLARSPPGRFHHRPADERRLSDADGLARRPDQALVCRRHVAPEPDQDRGPGAGPAAPAVLAPRAIAPRDAHPASVGRGRGSW
jgi:hypothetical protein